jgi:hypothetical protein
MLQAYPPLHKIRALGEDYRMEIKESKRTTSEPRGTRYSSRIVQEKQMEDGNEILFFEKQVSDG